MKNGLTRILFLLLTILCTGAGLSAQVAQFCSTPIPTGPVPITDDIFDPDNPQGSGLNSFGVTLSGLNASDNVTDISVEIAIDHTFIGDLTAYLVAPNGRAISLFSEPGPGISGFANLSANSPITFDDDSANDAEDMGAGLSSTNEAVCADNGLCDFFANADGVGQPPSFAGPEVITLLGLWDGADASNLNGQWNLFVGDDAGFDTGQIVSVDVCVTVGPSTCSISNLDITGIQCGAPNGTNLDDSYATFTFDVTGGSGEYITFVYFGGNTFSGGINAAPLPTDGDVSSFAQISVGGASGGDMVTIEVADNNNQPCRSMVSAPLTLPTCPVPVTAGTSTLESCTDGATTTDQQTGTIGPNEVIWYELVLNTDSDVRIDTEGSQTPGGTDGDTEIGLYDSDGNLIEDDDDGLVFPLSLIELSLVAGTYYVAVGEFNTIFGATDFDVTSIGPDFGLDVVVNFAIDCTPETVAVYDFSCPDDESADDTGILTDGTGVVFWYQINYDGSSMSDLFDINTFGSSPTDTELGIYDSDGNLIANNDDTGGIQSQLLVNLAAGTYYVAISEFNTIFGATNFDVMGGTAEGDEAYVINIELECDPCANDTNAPTISEAAGLNCDETFTAVTQLDYVYTVDPPSDGVSSNQDCKSMIILRTPQFSDDCGIDSIFVSFTGEAGDPVDFEDDFSLTVNGGDIPPGTLTTNIILPSLSFFSSASAPSATTRVTFEVFDAAGNSESCPYFIEVMDNQAPTAVCQDITVNLDANGAASIAPADIDGGSTDNCAIASLAASTTTFDCDNLVGSVVAYGGTVSSGNSNANTVTTSLGMDFTVTDPAGIVVTHLGAFDDDQDGISGSIEVRIYRIDSPTTGTVVAGPLIFTGSADPLVSLHRMKALGTPVTLSPGEYSIVAVGFTDTDLAGNDVLPGGDTTTTNGSGLMTFDQSRFGDMEFPTTPFPTPSVWHAGTFQYQVMGGINTVTLTVTDPSGNSMACDATVTVVDTIAPVLECEPMVTLELNEMGEDTIRNTDFTITMTDNCTDNPQGPLIVGTSDDRAFDCDDAGTTVDRMFFLRDDAGNESDTCTVSITVEDNTAPVITCPADVTVECDEENLDPFIESDETQTGTALGTVEAGTLNWTDGTSGAIGSVTSTVGGIPAGATVTDVNLTIQADHSWVGDLELSVISPDGSSLMFLADPCNNGNSDNANVTFDSDAGPFDCQTVVSDNGTPDDCSMDFLSGASMTGSMQPQFGDLSIFNGENAAGDWRLDIVDDAGGDGGCLYTFQVEVSWTSPAGVMVNPLVGAATATDNCDDDDVEITFSDSSTQEMDGPGQFNYEIFRTWIATDASDNADTCVQTITVEDSTDPVVTCPADVTVECDEENLDPFIESDETQTGTALGTVEAGTLNWTDGTSGAIGSVTSTVGGIPAGATVTDVNLTIQADHSWVGDLELSVISPDGSSLMFLADPCNNGNSDNANVTFDSDAGPFDCQTVSSDNGTPDDCSMDFLSGASMTGSMQPQFGDLSIFNGENAAGDWRLDITDDAGGDGGCLYTFQVEVSWTSPAGVMVNPVVGAATATDNCDPEPVITFSDSSTQEMDGFGQFNFEIFRTWIATDASGNADTCVQTITVEDSTDPVVTCPADVTVECDEDTAPFLDGEGTLDGMTTGTVEAGTLNWTDGTSGAIGSVTSTVAGIPAGATVTDVNLTIQADHSWVGDLELSVISPDGSSLMFLADPCNNGNSDNANVTFDSDAGPFDCQTVTSDNGSPDDCSMDFLGGAAMTGSMQPQFGDLSIFNGENAAGDWRLDIVDDAGGDGGCLYTFQVEISYTAPAAGEPNPVVGAATATDNCDPEPVITFQDSSTQVLDGSCDEFSYEIFRSWIATDATGNADTCVQVITVEDTQAPDLICTTVEVVLDDDLGNLELDDTDLDRVIAGTTDNCDPGFTAEFSQLEFDCSDIDPETNQITVDVLAADACGNDTMCTVQLDVMPQALDYDFACITEINVTLDADCEAELVPEMVLSGEFICLDLFDFEIVVMDDDPTNGAIIDGCGTFQYSITEVSEDFDAANFETCWGFVNAEDKTSPELEEDGEIVAPAPLYCDDLARINVNELPNGVSRCWIQSGQTGQTLNGSMNPALRQRLLAGGGIPNFVDGCSDVEICVNDQVENIGACEDMTITRIFTARDGISCEAEAGEENAPTVYSYEIIFTRPTIDDVDAITPTAEFECNDVLDLLPPNQFGDENPTPEFDDFPFFDDGSGPVYLTESFCNLGATFRDGPRIVTCENTYKFVRTFTVIDWCEPETIRDFTQLVKVGDFDAPVITAPTQDLNFNGIPDQEEGLGPIFFSTSNPDCSANFIIPAGDADDNCDDDPEVIALIYPNGNTDGAAVGPFQVGGPAFGIPVGVHTLRYIARDACDNADTLDVPLEVGDRTAPVAICEDGLDISLGGAGQAQLCGEDIDQASYDECSDITRLIAFVGANNLPLNDAQTLALTGIAQGGWRECITLTCELLDDDPDSPDFVAVGLLVTDASQNSNSCWLDVLVEDKLPPLCVAPGPVTTTCDDEDILSLPQDLNQAAQDDPTTTFAQLDQIFGSANGLDNCPDFDITQMVVDTRNSCGVGQILRSFFVTDGEGFNSTNPCSQTITVLGIHDYTIRFPEDFGSEACVEPDYDGVTFEERGCDLITTTTRIDTFEATADECYKLRITYEVLNWCEYSTEADPYEVPRDADNDDFLEEPTWVHVLPRDESTLSDDIAYLDSDANRFNGFISPLDLHDPNGQVFGASTQPYGTDESRGAFLYRQFIKVYDDVAPEVTDVTGDLVFEDEDGNCAEPVVLTIEVDDECTTEEDYTATAQLDPFFEDIDLDGILTLADFVPTADPSLQPNVVNNNDGTFTVSFNVELPLGRHAVRLRATDGCGNAETILIIFEVIDDKAPTPVCINGLTATLMPDGNGGGMAAIWANEYVVSGGEDCTGPVKFAIYHPDDFEALDNGTLIPNVIDTGIVLDCDDEGMLIVRVYAIDGNGNADYCETTLSVQAFQPNTCEGGDDGGNIFGLIESPAGTATPNVEVSISDDGSMSQMNVTDQSGEYSFTELALGEDYTIEPTLEAEVNVATAVTTFDILLINRHILAIAELQSPYQHVVADVNMDGQINVLDVVHIRMVIMGQRTDYPQGPTWRFADRDYAFSADPGNWASEAFAELHNINDLPGDILGADFYALEMGNVSEGVIAENGLLPEDGEARSRAVLTTESLQLTAGNSYELPFRAADLYGFQGTLELAAGLELMDITYGALHAQHVNLEAAAEGLIALSYDEVAGTTTEELFRLTVRATRDGALSELLSLTDRMTRAEGYPLSGGVADLNLDFTTAPLAADEFSLGQNAPNPVDRATQIAFTLPRAATATLTVRDVQGRTLLVREIEAGAGTNLLTLRREELGAAGVLSYTLTAGEFTATKQMVIR